MGVDWQVRWGWMSYNDKNWNWGGRKAEKMGEEGQSERGWQERQAPSYEFLCLNFVLIV